MPHGHSHGDGGQRPDFWTKVGAAGELVAGVVTYTFYNATIIDSMFRLSPGVIPYSWPGLAVGGAIALWEAVGTAYCHSVMNTNHQTTVGHGHAHGGSEEHDHAHVHDEECGHAHGGGEEHSHAKDKERSGHAHSHDDKGHGHAHGHDKGCDVEHDDVEHVHDEECGHKGKGDRKHKEEHDHKKDKHGHKDKKDKHGHKKEGHDHDHKKEHHKEHAATAAARGSVNSLGGSHTPLATPAADRGKLGVWQKIALAGDALAHTSDSAAPLSFIFDLISHNKELGGWWVRPLVISGFCAFGVLCGAVANVRTCWNNLREYNADDGDGHHHHDHHHGPSDIWTKLAIAGYAVNFVTYLFYNAGMFDSYTRLTPGWFNYSWEGVGFGVLVGGIMTGGSAYCHTIINQNYQTLPVEGRPAAGYGTAGPVPAAPRGWKSLKWNELAALAGDFLSHTADVASSPTFIYALATRNKNVPHYAMLIVNSGSTVIGGFCSVANLRTCKNSMLKQRRDSVGSETDAEPEEKRALLMP